MESTGGRKRKPLTPLTPDAIGAASLHAIKKTRRTDIEERRAGVVTHMTLKNFMCHSHLDVDFTSNITVVIGKNGSGKSAILTALIVGFGGKASLTNRGTCVKRFVKTGLPSATVEITVSNAGPMAYRPNVYGNHITIVRHFTAAGSSSYKIKADNGDVVATQAREIHNITAGLNIQVDNPCCILNQDTSRNFLSSNNPRHKYTLFMKATKLESLFEEYQKVHENKRESELLFDEKQANFQRLQEDLRKLRTKIDNHKSIVSLQDRVKAMQVELFWAKVRDSEMDVELEEKKIEGVQTKYNSLVEMCETRNEKIESITENIRTLEQQINQLRKTISVQIAPQNDIKKVIAELTIKYNDMKRVRTLESNSIDLKTKDANLLTQEIANVNENLSHVEQEKQKRFNDLTKLEDNIKVIEDHLATCRNDLYQIQNDGARKDEEKQNLRMEVSQIQSKITNETNRLNALKNESGNTLLLYGHDIPRVKQMIEQNKHRFTHLPKGPLGSYIKLKDRKWALAVEGYLGSAILGAFTVDNKKDNQILMEIFNKTFNNSSGGGRKPMIITSKFFFKKHNVKNNLVNAPSDCISLYNAMDIDDAVVANCIVDQSAVEGILLIPNVDRAIELLSNRMRVPRNCQQGVTIEGDKYYPDPNYKFYASTYHRAQYLQVDTKEHMLQLEQKIEQLMREKETITNQYQAMCREMNAQDSRRTELETKIRKLSAARVQIRNQLEELKATAEPEVINVQLLEHELIEIKATIKQKTTIIETLNSQIKDVKRLLTENEEKLRQIQHANQSLEDRVLPLDGQIRECLIRQKEISTSESFDKKRIQEYELQLKELNTILVTKLNVVRRQTTEAAALGARVNELRKVPDIISDITSVERSIRRIQTDTERVEDVIDKYKELQTKFKSTSLLMDQIVEDVRELAAASARRNRHYKLTESYCITYIKHSFKKILEFRQFEGSLDIDMEAKKLDLIVMPQQGSQGATTSANLSGGERSLSTVAFLYALWQCMDFPLYFLDEFDVYMDKLNRTKVIEILLHHAKSRPTLQFVFLTPQDVSFIDNSVTILRLDDPERIQNT